MRTAGAEPPGSFGAVTNRLAAVGAAVLAVLAVSGCGAVPAAGMAATGRRRGHQRRRLRAPARRRDGARGPVRHRRRPDHRHRAGGRRPQRPDAARAGRDHRSVPRRRRGVDHRRRPPGRHRLVRRGGPAGRPPRRRRRHARRLPGRRGPRWPASRRRSAEELPGAVRGVPRGPRDRLRPPRAGGDARRGAGRARRAGGRRVDRRPRRGALHGGSRRRRPAAPLQAAEDVDCAPIVGRRASASVSSSPRPRSRRWPGLPPGRSSRRLGWHVVEAQAVRRTSPRTSSPSTSRSAAQLQLRRSRASSTCDVDPRYGRWDPLTGSVGALT